MTVLQKFVTFAQSLPEGSIKDVEAALMTIMSSYENQDSLLSPEQEAENRRRFAKTDKVYAKSADIENLLGRKLPS